MNASAEGIHQIAAQNAANLGYEERTQRRDVDADDDLDEASVVSSADTEEHEDSAPNENLFINQIAPTVTSAEVRSLFTPFGEVVSHKIMVDMRTGKSRGFGFVLFRNASSATEAARVMNGYELHGQKLDVRHADSRTRHPGEPSNHLLLRYIPAGTTESELRDLFIGTHATVERVELLPDRHRSLVLADVTLTTSADALNCVAILNRSKNLTTSVHEGGAPTDGAAPSPSATTASAPTVTSTATTTSHWQPSLSPSGSPVVPSNSNQHDQSTYRPQGSSTKIEAKTAPPVRSHPSLTADRGAISIPRRLQKPLSVKMVDAKLNEAIQSARRRSSHLRNAQKQAPAAASPASPSPVASTQRHPDSRHLPPAATKPPATSQPENPQSFGHGFQPAASAPVSDPGRYSGLPSLGYAFPPLTPVPTANHVSPAAWPPSQPPTGFVPPPYAAPFVGTYGVAPAGYYSGPPVPSLHMRLPQQDPNVTVAAPTIFQPQLYHHPHPQFFQPQHLPSPSVLPHYYQHHIPQPQFHQQHPQYVSYQHWGMPPPTPATFGFTPPPQYPPPQHWP